jgi:hypothetical protein
MSLRIGLSSIVTIPTPDYDTLRSFRPVANLSTPRGYYNFYWWVDYRRIIYYDSTLGKWRMMPDWKIGATLEILTGIDVAELELGEEMRVFTGAQGPTGHDWVDGVDMDDDRRRHFLECEWSDYACDYLKVSGEVRRRAPVVTPAPRPIPFPQTPWRSWGSWAVAGAGAGARTDDDVAETETRDATDDEELRSPRNRLRYT